MITNQKDLDSFCSHLRTQNIIGVDTEFVREKSYYPILSLIQIATSSQIKCIDVLSSLDLTEIGGILADDKVMKIFHAARQDVEILSYHFKFVPTNIFDTQIAACFTGFMEPPSYEKLVRELCGNIISKDNQFSDWLRRPLSPSQIEYALGDVTYLIGMYETLRKSIEAKSMLSWLEEENKALESYLYTQPEAINFLGKFVQNFKGVQSLSRVYVLLLAREQQAERMNKPRNFIAKDDEISFVVKNSKGFERLSAKLGITEDAYLKQAESPEIHTIVKSYLLNCYKREDADKEAYNKLKTFLLNESKRLGIAPSLLANRNDLVALANGKVKGCKVLNGWRKEIFASYSNCAL
ncbi:MAG: Ribonuclease [Candidatus Midichloriaceae bacterium]|jgi:ribonuclease D|nr:Ribonuclease [Candidatus Midichloriaceae bacterium]